MTTHDDTTTFRCSECGRSWWWCSRRRGCRQFVVVATLAAPDAAAVLLVHYRSLLLLPILSMLCGGTSLDAGGLPLKNPTRSFSSSNQLHFCQEMVVVRFTATAARTTKGHSPSAENNFLSPLQLLCLFYVRRCTIK